MLKPVVYRHRPKLKGKISVVDAYTGAVKELVFLQNPALKTGLPEAELKLKKILKERKIADVWIYYPEKKVLAHTVNEHDYFKLRTARNRNIITEKEQLNFRKLSVGIAGLSVGSCILSSIVTSGGPKRIKIADFDTLEVTNLNRIKAKLYQVGTEKTAIAAAEIWGMDPFAEISLFNKGITEKNITNFLTGNPALDVFIDEMDSLPLKIQARFLCKKYKIPVIMATDNGDTAILDIERFDQFPKRKIFHGYLGNSQPKNFKNLTYRQWLTLSTKIVGAEFLTPKMQNSLLQISKTLPAVPQLGTTANLAGAAISLALRRIANNQTMPSGRYVISLEEKLIPGFLSPKSIKSRRLQTDKFIKSFR